MIETEAIIEFNNASIFQHDHLVLEGVSFSISPGEFVYLIGKVGSGKTSLIRTINAEIVLKIGEARVASYLLHKIKQKQIPFLRRKIGVVFQDFQILIDRSVHDNLEFVLRATGWSNKIEIENKINSVLDRVGLNLKGYKMPHQLSGGEQQRVVIARALLNNPEIILADEPTGNLDPDTSEEIFKLLLQISTEGTAVIVSTHNYMLLKKFQARTLRCEKERLIEVVYNDEMELIDE